MRPPGFKARSRIDTVLASHGYHRRVARTVASFNLALRLRQNYFAAYWANDVVANALPAQNTSALGFAPFGNAGPGGQFTNANTIVSGMKRAGYRTTGPSPYDGVGAGTHGSIDQLIAALRWFVGKSRQ